MGLLVIGTDRRRQIFRASRVEQQRLRETHALAMPLNGHSYLVGQGWEGHGSGLRKDAISRPLAIPQKKSLAGLGKDRDEAFPFWDQ